MKEVMIEYSIPVEIVKKPKKKLLKMDKHSMEVLEEFDSVKDASEKTGISASTISNVICTGFSAKNYLLAGDFRWQYSSEPNKKYYIHSTLGETEYQSMKSTYNKTDDKDVKRWEECKKRWVTCLRHNRRRVNKWQVSLKK